jgi:hypothetical protein
MIRAVSVLCFVTLTLLPRPADAGKDLANLFFYQNDPVTVKLPVAGVMVQLHSDRVTRYAESDDSGKFVFDGFSEGNYTVSAFAHGYPLDTHLLAEPQSIHIAKKSCARQMLLLPKKEGN